MIQLLNPMDEQLVLMGMSCVGKTTFAAVLKEQGYTVSHFDAQYTYNLTGLPGVSRIKNWARIIRGCEGKFVLDNWSTEDHLGKVIFENKPDACVCVLYDLYPNILDRYRVPVTGQDAYFMMYKRMYTEIPFEKYKKTRFFRVQGNDYIERTDEEFRAFVEQNLNPDHGRTFNKDTWTWEKHVPQE